MNDHGPRDFEQLNDRVVELESRSMHLDRTLEELNQVMRAQQRQIELLKRTMEKLEAHLEGLESTDVVRTPEEERPPHY